MNLSRKLFLASCKLRRLRLDRLFTIALLLIGLILLGYYATAPETQIARPVHGFAIETDQRIIHLTQFIMTLDVKSGVLSLNGEWHYVNSISDIGREFNIVVVLPFTIQAYNLVPFYMPAIDRWKSINTNITDVVASAVTANFSGNYTKYAVGYFYAEFIVAKTYANSHRGSYTIVIPLDAGIDGAYFPGLISVEREAGVYCCTQDDGTDVYAIFPNAAVNIQTFPPARLGFFNRYYDNATLNSAEWSMTQRTQVSLYFVDGAEQSTYEISVIVGSLLLGSGISGIADWLKERSTKT